MHKHHEDEQRLKAVQNMGYAGAAARISELERLLLTALAIHGGEAHTYSEKEWRTEARAALGLQKPDQE